MFVCGKIDDLNGFPRVVEDRKEVVVEVKGVGVVLVTGLNRKGKKGLVFEGTKNLVNKRFEESLSFFVDKSKSCITTFKSYPNFPHKKERESVKP